MRPDPVRGVVGISVLPLPRGPEPILALNRRVYQGRFYTTYTEKTGVTDDEMNADVRSSLRRIYYGLAGENPENATPWPLLVPEGGLLDAFGGTDKLPTWMTENDLENAAQLFKTGGFTAALNWYRNMDTDWIYQSTFARARLEIPGLYMAGDKDTTLSFSGIADMVVALRSLHPGLREPVILPDCGHWTQQEKPDEVTTGLLDFLRSLD